MGKRAGIPIACDLNALVPAERERRSTLVGAVVHAIVGRAELDHGFELRVDLAKLDLPALA
jgi:hypothetical protein